MTDWRASLTQREWVSPMPAVLTDRRFSAPDWIHERKFDGERLLLFRNGDDVRLMARNRKRANDTYPELIDACRDQDHSDFVVDGEVVALKGAVSSFSRLQQRIQIRDGNGSLRYAGKVGTGHDDRFLTEFRARLDDHAVEDCPFADDPGSRSTTWVDPRFVGEFGFTESTDDGKLRHPRFLGLRRDKNPREVGRETLDG